MPELKWSTPQLEVFSAADDFHVSPFYADGQTFGTPTWIWSVVVADRLFIRAWNGPASRWYRSAVQQGAGKFSLNGADHLATFKKLTDAVVNDLVDQGYQQKYQGSPYLSPMLQQGPKSTTIEVLPR